MKVSWNNGSGDKNAFHKSVDTPTKSIFSSWAGKACVSVTIVYNTLYSFNMFYFHVLTLYCPYNYVLVFPTVFKLFCVLDVSVLLHFDWSLLAVCTWVCSDGSQNVALFRLIPLCWTLWLWYFYVSKCSASIQIPHIQTVLMKHIEVAALGHKMWQFIDRFLQSYMLLTFLLI